MFQIRQSQSLKMEKRKPEDHQSNGDAGGKRAKMDPDCGTLVFCGSTEWHCVGFLN